MKWILYRLSFPFPTFYCLFFLPSLPSNPHFPISFAKGKKRNTNPWWVGGKNRICKQDKGKGEWVYEISKLYGSEIIPLTLTRVSGTSIGLDIDLHLEIIQLVGYLFQPYVNEESNNLSQTSSRLFLPTNMKLLWKPVLTHLLRVLNIISILYKKLKSYQPLDELQVNKDSSWKLHNQQSNFQLGHFHSIPIYVDFYNLLNKQLLDLTITSLDMNKFDFLCKYCLFSLVGIIRASGKDILNYSDEILNYIQIHTDKYPNEVSLIVFELFLSSITQHDSTFYSIPSSTASPLPPPSSSPSLLHPPSSPILPRNFSSSSFESDTPSSLPLPVQAGNTLIRSSSETFLSSNSPNLAKQAATSRKSSLATSVITDKHVKPSVPSSPLPGRDQNIRNFRKCSISSLNSLSSSSFSSSSWSDNQLHSSLPVPSSIHPYQPYLHDQFLHTAVSAVPPISIPVSVSLPSKPSTPQTHKLPSSSSSSSSKGNQCLLFFSFLSLFFPPPPLPPCSPHLLPSLF